MSNTYYISGDTPILGYLSECPKCHRKILIETILCGVSHNVSVTAVCAECVDIPAEFQEKNPEVSKQIKEWAGRNEELPPGFGFEGCY